MGDRAPRNSSVELSLKAAEQEYKVVSRLATREGAPKAEKDYYARSLAVVSAYYEDAKFRAERDRKKKPTWRKSYE